jgi:hypothetical protein
VPKPLSLERVRTDQFAAQDVLNDVGYDRSAPATRRDRNAVDAFVSSQSYYTDLAIRGAPT